jgi:PPOX class probable F420-dependent enzyme
MTTRETAMQIPPSARELLTSDAIAHFTTIDEDGRPHVTCAWVGLDGDELLVGTLFDQRKLRNIRRDPRVVVSMQSGRTNEYGLAEYLVVYGRGTVVEGGAPDLLQELAYTYLGEGVKFPPMEDPPPGYVTRIAVDEIGGVGPWRQESAG